ncbi:MAG: Rab family GTPase [Promethearchaeota archaeon]
MNFKVVFVGDERVGKTSLVRRFVDDRFTEEYIRTLGFEVSTKSVKVGDVEVVLTIWDIGRRTGKDDPLIKSYFTGARGVFIVYDLTREDTLNRVERWVNYVRESLPEAHLLVLGNKVDLVERPDVNAAESLVARLGLARHAFTSAKTGENVERAFLDMTRAILRA